MQVFTMRLKHRMLFVLCIFLSCSQIRGVEFQINRSHDNFYDHLVCNAATDKTDNRIFSIIDISIIDYTHPWNKVKLASASVLHADLYVQFSKDNLKVNGSASRYEASLDIRFNKNSQCELGRYLCELNFINLAGNIDKLHTVLKPEPPDGSRSDLMDSSDLILSEQLIELKGQFVEAMTMLANRTENMEETLGKLTGHVANMTSLNDRTLAEKQVSTSKDDSYPNLDSVTLGASSDITTTAKTESAQGDETTEDSKIDFHATPESVTVGLTTILTLMCSLPVPDDQRNTPVSRTELQMHHAKDQMMSSRDGSSEFHKKRVISTLITKIGVTNETVASIVAGDVPVGYMSSEKAHVEGRIVFDSESSERAYLKVSWYLPGSELGGRYECKIHTVDAAGQPVLYKGNAFVHTSQLNIFQVAEKLLELEYKHNTTKEQLSQTTLLLSETILRLSETESELNETKSELNNVIQRLSETESELNNTKQKLSLGESELNTAKQQIATLQSKTANLTSPHTEHGTVYCSSWSNANIYVNYSETEGYQWSPQYGKECVQDIVFENPYRGIPAVMISTSMMKSNTGVTASGSLAYIGVIYQIKVEDITTHGFTIRCVAYYQNNNYEYIQRMNIDWISTIKG